MGKWISGEANSEEWTPSDSDENAGTGYYGSCRAEMDIWEANMITQAYTTHPCSIVLTDVKVLNVVTMPAEKDMTVSATRMDVTSAHGVWETTNTMDLDQNSKLIPPNHLPSLLNLSLPMVQKTEI